MPAATTAAWASLARMPPATSRSGPRARAISAASASHERYAETGDAGLRARTAAAAGRGTGQARHPRAGGAPRPAARRRRPPALDRDARRRLPQEVRGRRIVPRDGQGRRSRRSRTRARRTIELKRKTPRNVAGRFCILLGAEQRGRGTQYLVVAGLGRSASGL